MSERQKRIKKQREFKEFLFKMEILGIMFLFVQTIRLVVELMNNLQNI